MQAVIFRVVLAVSLMGGAGWGFAAPVLKTGQCSPAGEVRAALKAEGLNPIVMGNRRGYGYKTAFIFMATVDGSRGYLVRGDKPLGEQASIICIDSVFTSVRLNDISKPGLPVWAKLGGDPATANAVCKRDKLGYQEECMFHDESLTNVDSHGYRVMLMAVGTAINPRDKTVRDNQTLLLTILPKDNGGLVNASTPEGASYLISAYTEASYTQFGEALLKR